MRKLLSFAPLIICAAAQVQASIVFFPNDLAGFTAAMTANGNGFLGTETFEQSTLAPAFNSFVDDPLSQGVANGPFPAGLLQAMTVQSNQDGAAAVAPNPRGTNGLGTFSVGFNDAGSDVVVASNPGDSLDWIFTSLGGLGFNPLNYLSAVPNQADTVEIEVYNTANALLGATSIVGDPGGTQFLGIQVTGGDLIGRVNFFTPGTGPGGAGIEGGDNAMLFRAVSQPVPEPRTLLLLLVAGASMGLMRRCRRQ